MLLIKHFYTHTLILFGLCLFNTVLQAEPVLGSDTHLGTWHRACTFMKGNEREPIFSQTNAELKEKDIKIEIKIFTDANCTKRSVLLPEVLFEGHYTLGNFTKKAFVSEKAVGVIPMHIKIHSYNNHKVIKEDNKFTAYKSGNTIHIPVQGEVFPYAMTFKRKNVKVRTAEEVYKNTNNSGRAGLSCIITPKDPRFAESAQWCLDNIDFPEPRFRELCKGENSIDLMNTIAKNCPARMVSYCEYGRKEYGYVIRRFYTTEHFKLFPNIEQHCKAIFNGAWFD